MREGALGVFIQEGNAVESPLVEVAGSLPALLLRGRRRLLPGIKPQFLPNGESALAHGEGMLFSHRNGYQSTTMTSVSLSTNRYFGINLT